MTVPALASLVVPQALCPGDTVRVVAPSSRFDPTLVWRGLGWLRERYRVEFDPLLFSRDGMFAGRDERRLGELQAALVAPGVRAIVAARGGYGATRIAHRIDWRLLRRSPKWLVGFSDVTALHVEAARARVASLHAHNVGGLGRGDAVERALWLEALEHPEACRSVDGLEIWQPGKARGPLFGGNLTLLVTCAAAGRLEVPPGAVLVLEDLGEAAYRIDRMLSALCVSGQLARVSAVVAGDFIDCPTGQFGAPALDVVRERMRGLGVPMLGGLRVGHGRHNLPLPLGLTAEVDGFAGRLTLCPNA
jgi:muramoyltetrapeptide carboxypeptidase